MSAHDDITQAERDVKLILDAANGIAPDDYVADPAQARAIMREEHWVRTNLTALLALVTSLRSAECKRDAALAASPADLTAQVRARYRGEALRAAADLLVNRDGGPERLDVYDGQDAARWLRELAAESEKGGTPR